MGATQLDSFKVMIWTDSISVHCAAPGEGQATKHTRACCCLQEACTRIREAAESLSKRRQLREANLNPARPGEAAKLLNLCHRKTFDLAGAGRWSTAVGPELQMRPLSRHWTPA